MYMERFKRCQSELKVALGESYGDKYSGRENSKRTFRKYLRELEKRAKELRREELTRAETIAADKETRERANTLKLEEMRLAHEATERAEERKLAAEERKLAAEECALERKLAAEKEARGTERAAARERRPSAPRGSDAIKTATSEARESP